MLGCRLTQPFSPAPRNPSAAASGGGESAYVQIGVDDNSELRLKYHPPVEGQDGLQIVRDTWALCSVSLSIHTAFASALFRLWFDKR